MSIRTIVTTAALVAGLAASAAAPTLAAGRANHDGISRQYESLAETRAPAPAPAYQGHTVTVMGLTFTQ